MKALPPISTGTPGLDEVLCGGLPAQRVYLLQGEPGAGKTTLGLRFLLAGVERGERCLYVTLSESRAELRAVASSHGWDIEKMDIYELASDDVMGIEDAENTLYVPAEVELGERMRALLKEVARVRPTRMVLDSCSELRLLAQSPLRLRRQLLALKQQLVQQGVTVLLLDSSPPEESDTALQSLVHGVIYLEQSSPLYGASRRRLRVLKMREVDFRGGYHDIAMRRGGVEVFPRLIAAEHHEEFRAGSMSSGVPELDALLGGGLDLGTSALLVGPAGSGKSSIAIQYVVAAAKRGQHAAVFSFDEGLQILHNRSRGLGMDLTPHIESGKVRLQQIDPAELSPGEFVSVVRNAVARSGAKLVVIDSLNGYLHAMPEERYLTVQLHELLSFLSQRGVLTILVMAQHGFVGTLEGGPVDVSYLADTLVLTRFFETSGRVRKALSVVKKRSGGHEDTIREFALEHGRFVVGPPLRNFQGILSGSPKFDGREVAPLLPALDGAP